MASYDTNLAAEFYILSCLHRLGIDASLTLGNKKGVDVFVARANGDSVTVEVKGVAGKYDWPAANLRETSKRHYVVLVCFDGKINDASMPPPRVWVIPYSAMKDYMREYKGGRTNVSRAAVMKGAGAYENAWHLIQR